MFCAAKFIPLQSKTRVQVYQERDILATLNHPLVTGLLDQFETRKTLILVLELYPALDSLGSKRSSRPQTRVGRAVYMGSMGLAGHGDSSLGPSVPLRKLEAPSPISWLSLISSEFMSSS
jgi:serine/threonine protein kinase